MPRRPQFTVRALLVAMLIVGAFFGGMAVQQQLSEEERSRLRRELHRALQDELDRERFGPSSTLGARFLGTAKKLTDFYGFCLTAGEQRGRRDTSPPRGRLHAASDLLYDGVQTVTYRTAPSRIEQLSKAVAGSRSPIAEWNRKEVG